MVICWRKCCTGTQIQSQNNHMLPTQMSGTSKNNNRISRFFKKNCSQTRRQDAEALHCHETPFAVGGGGRCPRNARKPRIREARSYNYSCFASSSRRRRLGRHPSDGRRTSEPEHLRRRRKIAQRAGHGGSYKLKKLYFFRL